MEPENEHPETLLKPADDSIDEGMRAAIGNVAVSIGNVAKSMIEHNIEFLESKKSENLDSSDDDFYDSQINMQKKISELMDTSMNSSIELFKARSEIKKLQNTNSELETELSSKNEEINQLKHTIEEQQILIQNYQKQLQTQTNDSQ